MSKLKLSSVKVDLKREEDGAEIEYKPWPGVFFKVRSNKSQTFTVAQAKMFQRWAAKYGEDPVPADVISSDVGKLVCDTLLIGWNGIDEPYSPNKALEILCDESYREIRAAVEWCAGRVSIITPQFDEAAAKN